MADNGTSALAPSAQVESLEGAQRDEWLKTGELPADKAAPAPKNEVVGDKAGKAAAEEEETTRFDVKPASERAPRPGQMGYKALRDRVQTLEAELAAAKTGKNEPPPKDSPAGKEGQAADAQLRPKPTPSDKAADGKLKYATYEDYIEDFTAWKQQEYAEKSKVQTAEDAKKKAVEAKAAEVVTEWNKGVADARKKHADWDTVAMNKDLPIPPGCHVESWCLDDPAIGAELIYYLAKDPARIARINAMKASHAARELTLVEAEMAEANEETPPVDPKKEKKFVSDAPPPPRESGNRSAVNDDPVSEAVAEGDFDKYREAANAADKKNRSR